MGATVLVVPEIDISDPVTEAGHVLRAYATAMRDARWREDPVAAFGAIGYERPARLEGAEQLRAETASDADVNVLRTLYALDGDTVEVIQRMRPVAIALDELVVTGQRADSVTPPPAARADNVAQRAEAGADEPAIMRVTIRGDAEDVFQGRNVVTVTRVDRVIVLASRMAADSLASIAARIR